MHHHEQALTDTIDKAVTRLRAAAEDGAEEAQEAAAEAALALAEAAKGLAETAKRKGEALVEGALDDARAHPLRTAAITAATLAALASVALVVTRQRHA